LAEVTESLGKFQFLIDGIKNPASFKASGAYRDIHMEDKDGYRIQKEGNLASKFVKTDIVATVQNYNLIQSTEQYGEDTDMKLIVYTYNPIPVGGFIQISWPETVVLYQQTECTVSTSRLITKENACAIDHIAQTISITGAFTETAYNGPVHVTLSLVTNPITNKDMKSFVF
jgi:hypothetical protein